jgi:ubiquinone/menaquinone biosynthesis C-methylase UbiE
MSSEIKDARNLSTYKNDIFDLVLFSHGGLDAVNHSDRIHILNEIYRICKKGGYFCFSTSNLEAVAKFCVVKLSSNPKVMARKIVSLLLVRLLNPEIWDYSRGKRMELKHSMYILGGHNWSLKTYCISLTEQLKQLGKIKF